MKRAGRRFGLLGGYAGGLLLVILLGMSMGSGAPLEAAQKVRVFFYVVNETGCNVKVRILADGEELLVREVPGRVVPLPGKEVPPAFPYPALEVKIPMDRNVSQLEVQGLVDGGQVVRAIFEIGALGRRNGFRIIVQRNRILLTRDYVPVR